MDYVHLMIIAFFISYCNHSLNSTFVPDRSDYNAYGLKIAMNEILFIQVHNEQNSPTFLVQFGPYNSTQKSLQCSINIANLTDHYIYSVAISETDREFFFVGELINGQHGTFVGVVKIRHPNLLIDMNPNQLNLCNSSYSYSIEYFYKYEHEEYYQLGVKPNGRYAYGFSNKFVFIFDSHNVSTLASWDGNLIWPDKSFMPHAVHLSDHFGIIAGFIENVPDAIVRYIPIIYLINFNLLNDHPTIVDQYIPVATPATWQDLLINSDANIYSAKYDMSVSINKWGDILVGMQYINRVFFLSVDLFKSTKLIYKSRFTNGRSLGYGKSVAWLDNGNMAAILANTYSFEYDWQLSQIYFYDMQSKIYNSESKPLSVFPNCHQRLPKRFNSIFLNIVSSSISLSLLDNDGNVLIFVPTPSGFFPSIENTESMPLITLQQPCLPGTYKNETGINDCILCPPHTKNGGHFHTQCVPCSPLSFCPLGSSDETYLSALNERIASFPYPKSSEIRSFDAVLLSNIFGIKRSNCSIAPTLLLISIVGPGLVLLIVPIMCIFKYLIQNPKIKKIRKGMKGLLKGIDLINEGKLWLGGIASFVLIILIVCTCKFAYDFFHSYPIENASVSYFSCDSAPLVNAVFESSVKSLGFPRIDAEQKMIDLLDGQNFTLNVDFVNTLISCDAAAIQGLFGTTWSTLRWSICESVNSTLSLSIPLPHQHISVNVLLADIKTIGGLRIGLYGDQYISDSYTLKKLYFSKSFYKNGYLLGKTIPLSLTLTKVINETVSMEDETSQYSGIYIPTFDVDLDNILLSSDQYILSTLSSISLLISLTESSYYEKNLQEPMARKSQVIFYCILITIAYLGLLQFPFLLYKLLLKPIHDYLRGKNLLLWKKKKKKRINPEIQPAKIDTTSSLSEFDLSNKIDKF